MKHRKSSIHRKFHSLPKLRFKEIALTSFAGLILYQKLFKRIDLKSKLRQCFQHLKVNPTYGAPVVFLQLIIHVLLGFRQLRHQAYYQDDPMVKRVLGLTHGRFQASCRLKFIFTPPDFLSNFFWFYSDLSVPLLLDPSS